MPVHIGAGSLHLRIFGDRLLKMELPVSGLGLLFQLGHLLKRLVRAALIVVLVVTDNGLGGNLRLMGGFHTGVFLLHLMNFAVNAGGKSIADLKVAVIFKLPESCQNSIGAFLADRRKTFR